MYESDEEIAELQIIMDRSYERQGTHASFIITPERRITARQMVDYLTCMKHIVVGTVTSSGEPRVAPVDGHFIHGRFWFGTGQAAFRIQHLRRNPAVSACHLAGDDLGIVVHGRASLFGPEDPEGEMMREHFRTITSQIRTHGRVGTQRGCASTPRPSRPSPWTRPRFRARHPNRCT